MEKSLFCRRCKQKLLYCFQSRKDIVIFAFIGAVVAVMYVLIANMLDTTVKTQEDIEKSIKIPVLASIPLYDMGMEKLKKRKGGRR